MISPESVLEGAGLAGRASAREGAEPDAMDGVRPRVVIEPDSRDALAALLAWASQEHLSVVLRGSGTKVEWGREPRGVDLVVCTRRLNRVLAHQHGDLTATVEGGTTVEELNHELRRHGQWLPIDVPFRGATIGGTIAAGDSGPIRHRHGTARDLLIGVHLGLTDGRIVKSGGNVVKNVAGYDLGKLMSGSFGALAAIVSATFKLSPLPAAAATLLGAFDTREALARAVTAVMASQLEPVALDLHVFVPPQPTGPAMERPRAWQLLTQFASTAEAVRAQADAAERLLAADQLKVVESEAEADAWREHADSVWRAPGAIVRVSWLPASLPAVLTIVEEIGALSGGAVGFIGRAGVGAGFIRIDAGADGQIRAIERLRSSPAVGHAVVVRAPVAVKAKADVWGPPGDTAALALSVKRALDPGGILGAGRGPI